MGFEPTQAYAIGSSARPLWPGSGTPAPCYGAGPGLPMGQGSIIWALIALPYRIYFLEYDWAIMRSLLESI